jgi:protein-glutamine gamma-glutamyltransferase
MVSDMQGLIPGLTYPRDLYFPTEKVAIDAEGTIRTPGYLPEGLTYTLISQVPYRNETVLGKINPEYNQKRLSYYLQVPENITEKVRKKTEEILAKSEKPLTTPYWKAKYLAQYLKQHFRLPENATGEPLIGENEDLVEAFLFQNEGGYIDHFSTTLTIMLRSIGIPARLVAGFSPGQFNPFTGLYIVKNTNAYTMTEVYFGQNYGWFAFDPIPTHPLIPPSIEDDQTFSVLREFWKAIAGILPSPISSWFSAIFGELMNWIGIAIIWLWSVLSNGWSGFFASIILAIVVGFIGWILWTQWQKFSNYLWLKKLDPMEGIYQQMLMLLKERGFPKHPAQTPYEYARNSRQQYDPEIADLISSISQHYEKWRYGGKQPNFEELKQQLRMLKKHLSLLAKIRKPLR